jgi:peptide/nickel transport system ATP-binding protein
MRVGEQVCEVIRAHDTLTKRASFVRALDLFAAVNMPQPAEIASRYPHQISGGQQQRVLIAMALACNPDLLIMDEPTTGLDVTTEAQILDLVEALKKRFSSAILYISHNLGVIARISDHVVVMYAGQVVERGPVGEVYHAQQHPYTAGLLRCLPNLSFGRKARSLEVIRGMIPDLARLPDGCVFEPRCPFARELCRERPPALAQVAPGHFSRCLFSQEVVQGAPAHQKAITTGSAVPAEGRDAGSSHTSPLLEVQNLVKHYRQRGQLLGFLGNRVPLRALDDVSFSLPPNETLAVVGESGCGKTTLARCVVGLVEPTSGRLRFAGQDATIPTSRRHREIHRRLQMVFQNPDATLNPRRSIGDALVRPLQLFGKMSRKAARDTATELLRAVRLEERYLERLPSQLSGGEKQRVGIARAFAANPDLVVCDEPVSALDVSVQAAILNLLSDLQKKRLTAYLFISHDLSVVRYLADHVVVIYLGKICEIGPVERVFGSPYHPYTEALLSAVPVPDPEAIVGRIRLEGPVPNPANPPTGCVFHTRCPRKIGTICETLPPPTRSARDGHQIVCHLSLEDLARVQGDTARA